MSSPSTTHAQPEQETPSAFVPALVDLMLRIDVKDGTDTVSGPVPDFAPVVDYVPVQDINFLDFPAEIRLKIIEHYLAAELRNGTLALAMHTDKFGMECCVWNWPEELVLCDKATDAGFPDLVKPDFAPMLAHASSQMRGEVLVHMLQTTDQIVLKYYPDRASKVALWFTKFLGTFPKNQGFEAIKDLNLPHIHWYNQNRDIAANAPNPDVDLMLKCPNLRTVRLTFHFKSITWYHPYDEQYAPISQEGFEKKFKLGRMVGCNNLKDLHIGGIKWRDAWVVDDALRTVRDFGKWLREECAKKDPKQEVSVQLYPRYGPFSGWTGGEPL